MQNHVEITFDCTPLRSLGRMDIPLDATDVYRVRCEAMTKAVNRWGAEHTYYLENAHCVFHLANSEMQGMLRFDFTGVVQTDVGDARTKQVELAIITKAETCGGVPQEVETWFHRIVQDAVAIEFDRFIASGSRDKILQEHVGISSSPEAFTGGDL